MGFFLSILGKFSTSALNALLSTVLNYFKAKSDNELAGFQTAAGLDAANFQKFLEAQVATNQAKLAANGWWGAKFMVFAFGLPAVLHWGAVFLDSTFRFGWKVPALPGEYAGAEQQIALSFFIVLPAMPVVSAVSAWLSKK
jgi:hypothetical protein